MTPLAFELFGDLTSRDSGSFFYNESSRKTSWAAMNCKFFDLSSVNALVQDAGIKMAKQFDHQGAFSSRLAFLPAPATWLETVDADGTRLATILVSPDESTTDSTSFQILTKDDAGKWVYIGIGNNKLPLVNSGLRPDKDSIFEYIASMNLKKEKIARDEIMCWLFRAYASLALINSQRIIGRRQHMPHERIEREHIKTLGLVGKFPLHAWTEILLRVALPDDRTGDPSTEAHLTGERCLHFCRTHLRVRNGLLEYVEAHWRGNPALGLKQSRYAVVGEKR